MEDGIDGDEGVINQTRTPFFTPRRDRWGRGCDKSDPYMVSSRPHGVYAEGGVMKSGRYLLCMDGNYGGTDGKGFEAAEAKILFTVLLVEFGKAVGFKIDDEACDLIAAGTTMVLDGVQVLLIEKLFVSHYITSLDVQA